MLQAQPSLATPGTEAHPSRAEIIREMALALPPLSGETRARLRPLLSGSIPDPAAEDAA